MLQSLFILSKPRIGAMVLISTMIGYFLGAGTFTIDSTLGLTLLGTFMTCGGAAALNSFIERDSDRYMKRTANRPIQTGAIHPATALAYGTLMVLSGTTLLITETNLLTGFLALLTAFLYVLVYTPLKKITWLNTFVGAIPGALPPVGGWTAATGELSLGAILLFLILFVWQIPHFFAIAWIYREDYRQAGIKMLPATEHDGKKTFRQVILFSVLLLPITLLPGLIGGAGNWYLTGGVIAGLIMLIAAIIFVRSGTNDSARGLLRASLFYLPILLIFATGDLFAEATHSELRNFGTLPNQTFIDTHKNAYTLRSEDGKVRLMYFFFSRCPAICPKVHKKLSELFQQYKDNEQVTFLSVSVDPENDTPETLNLYGEQYRGNSTNWKFLTGAGEELLTGLFAQLRLARGELPDQHTTRIILVDRAGNLRGFYNGLDQEQFVELEKSLKILMKN